MIIILVSNIKGEDLAKGTKRLYALLKDINRVACEREIETLNSYLARYLKLNKCKYTYEMVCGGSDL
jgi:hypothetical protein